MSMTETFRKIIHIDMDAFFASVEQLDNPELKGRPVAVGGQPNTRGVVAAASYEARKFGIHSAMSSFKASQLCKDLCFVPPRISRYRELSLKIHEVFNRYTDIIEPLSLDEAFLDVSNSDMQQGSATLIANDIRKAINQATGLTASAGVSYNKFLAKLASDMNKPDGMFVIKPGSAVELISDLPVKKIFGVGKVTEKKMQSLNIHKIKDITRFGENLLSHHFGKQGRYYYNLSLGIDNRPVNTSRERKSIGRERTFSEDLIDKREIDKQLDFLLDQVVERMQKNHVLAKTISLKVKYHDFDLITRSQTSMELFSSKENMKPVLIDLMKKTLIGQKAIRLLGVSVSGLHDNDVAGKQAILF